MVVDRSRQGRLVQQRDEAGDDLQPRSELDNQSGQTHFRDEGDGVDPLEGVALLLGHAVGLGLSGHGLQAWPVRERWRLRELHVNFTCHFRRVTLFAVV
jgi:hypothetical protein